MLVLFLREKGNVPPAGSVELQSRKGLTKLNLSWRAVKLWELSAEDLLAAGDIGLVPWVPLADFQGPPERIVRRCRARIDRDAPSIEHENLLAVTQFLLGLRYNDSMLIERLRALLGGRQAMIESPIYQELEAELTRKIATETRQKDILKVLITRFGDAAKDLAAELEAIEYDRLEGLLERALRCRNLASFRKRLSP